jgi:hypothetical protein
LQRLRDDSATGWDDSFILTADIDMGGCTWTSTIGNSSTAFTGRLDGGGFDISGLTIAISTSTSHAYGGLVGHLKSPGVVTRIGFSGNVSAESVRLMYFEKRAYAGGLVGYANSGTTISYSTASGSVSAATPNNGGGIDLYSYAGGLVGYANSSTISDSFATGAVSATAANIGGTIVIEAGGLVGDATGGVVNRSYANGNATVSGGSRNGGLVGSRTTGTFSDNFHDTTTGLATAVGNGSSTGIAGKTTAQLQQFATYDDSNWDIVNGWQAFDPGNGKVWGICAGNTRAFLLWQYTVDPCASAPAPSPPPPPPLAIAPTSQVLTGQVGTPVTATSTFALENFTLIPRYVVYPALPAGLTLDPTTGVVSGTPTEVYPSTRHWITATAGGNAESAYCTLQVSVAAAPTPTPAVVALTGSAGGALPTSILTGSTLGVRIAVTDTTGAPIPGSSVQVELTGQATLSGGGTRVTGTTDTQGHLQVSVLGGAVGEFQVSATAGTITTSSGPIAVVAPTITITGTRQGERITITGTSTHLAGQTLRPWTRSPGHAEYTEGPAVIPVNDDGTFTWTRRASKTISIYLAHATTKSNTVTIRAR